jgi:hypothetical protein
MYNTPCGVSRALELPPARSSSLALLRVSPGFFRFETWVVLALGFSLSLSLSDSGREKAERISHTSSSHISAASSHFGMHRCSGPAVLLEWPVPAPKKIRRGPAPSNPFPFRTLRNPSTKPRLSRSPPLLGLPSPPIFDDVKKTTSPQKGRNPKTDGKFALSPQKRPPLKGL